MKSACKSGVAIFALLWAQVGAAATAEEGQHAILQSVSNTFIPANLEGSGNSNEVGLEQVLRQLSSVKIARRNEDNSTKVRAKASALPQLESNGAGYEQPVNDTDPANFPQTSEQINNNTLILISIPLGIGLSCLCCGILFSFGGCRRCVGDLIWKIRPLKPVIREEDAEGEEGREREGEEVLDHDLERAKEKAKRMGDWTLDIKIIQARNLPKSDWALMDSFLVGLADPYAAVGMRNRRRERKKPYAPEFKTTIKKSTLNPSWNEVFRLQFSGTQDEVSIQIWDFDKWKFDDYLGEALIPTAPLVAAWKPGRTEFSDSMWYELYDKNGSVVTAAKTGKQLDLISAVEIQLKLDKTYDPEQALNDMKRAMDTFRSRAEADKLAEQRAAALAEAQRKRMRMARTDATQQMDPQARAQSQALHAGLHQVTERDHYMRSLPKSRANQPVVRTTEDPKKKKKPGTTKS